MMLPTEQLSAFDPAWLVRQRWFRAKQRPIAAVELADVAKLAPHAWLAVLGVRYRDGGTDRYVVPAVDHEGILREARDGEGAGRAMVASMAAGRELPGRAGTFVFAATSVLPELMPSPREAALVLAERRLRVEQTNSSVVLGERLILKLFRLLEPGPNPDLEVGAFLTEVGFSHTPALAGSLIYLVDGSHYTAAMLQAFLPAAGDAWAHLLRLLGTAEGAEAALADARRIGVLTAELHAALASRPTDPAFPVREASADELAAWRSSAARQLHGALESLSGNERVRLEAAGPGVEAAFDAIGQADGARVSRIHGDYHLGQLLRVGDEFVAIDFEGEPARAIDERRAPASPLKDVAGMLRSLDYAARTAQRERSPVDADSWLASARAALLDGYGPIDPRGAGAALLAAFELEKACYEVRYEANNRPAWVWLPLEALIRLADDRGVRG